MNSLPHTVNEVTIIEAPGWLLAGCWPGSRHALPDTKKQGVLQC